MPAYEPFYPDGFKDLPDETTPVTAAFLNRLEATLADLDAMVDAHAITLATLAADKSPGLLDWASGTYRAGWPAIYGGQLYVARDTTTEPPVVGAPLSAPVSEPVEWAHNAIAGIDAGVVSLVNGAAASGAGPTVLERATHTNLIGTTISVEARAQDSSSNVTNRGLMIGILDAAKALTTTNLSAASSGFYGVRLGPGVLYAVSNGGSSGTLMTSQSGVGLFDWSTVGVRFLEASATELTVVLSRDGVELGRGNIAKPPSSAYRIAIGSHVATALTATQHQVRGVPVLGQQSAHWRRVGAVADLT